MARKKEPKPPIPPGLAPSPRTRSTATSPAESQSMSLRDLTRVAPTNAEFEHALNQIRDIDDRGAAILLTALVEHHLEMAILQHLVRADDDTVSNLVDVGGPLSSFYAKIYLGYAMGIYDGDLKAHLDVIRHIRNAFAHARIPLSFWTPQIIDECKKLPSSGLPATPLANMIAGICESKERFISICFVLILRLIEAVGVALSSQNKFS